MARTMSFVGAAPFDGGPAAVGYCLWRYQLSWTGQNSATAGYVVKKGDTLWTIAGTYLQDPKRWPEIWRLNKAAVANPNLIFPGQTLVLPSFGALEAQVAIGLSADIDIIDPATLPANPLLGGMSLSRTTGAAVQYVVAALAPGAASPLALAFVAPCTANAATPMLLATRASSGGGWLDLVFDVSGDSGLSATQQVLNGPAAPVAPPVIPPVGGGGTGTGGGSGTGGGTGSGGGSPGTGGGTPISFPPGPPPSLHGSSRRIELATLVSVKTPQADGGGGSGPPVVVRFAFANRLNLQPGEVGAARQTMAQAPDGTPASDALKAHSDVGSPAWSVLRSLEGGNDVGRASALGSFSAVPAPLLAQVGTAVLANRQAAADAAKGTPAAAPAAAKLAEATGATNWFEINVNAAPYGWINLERMEMTPVGIERGELIATIPLAPGEETVVVHKEWSVISQEYTSVVTDSLDNYSETGVTENTELAQATTSQTTHSNQFNVNGSVSGGFAPVITATSASGFTAQNQGSDSATSSVKNAIATTRKASSRVKQSHKTTISTTSASGTADLNQQRLRNPSTIDPIRIDYFSMMRKWHVGMYRYGIRMTFDVAIPEPASAMRQTYAQMDLLQKQLGPFVFPVTHGSITVDNYQQLADTYGAQVPLPPTLPIPDIIQSGSAPQTPDASQNGEIPFAIPDINVPAGYWITELHLSFTMTPHGGEVGQGAEFLEFAIIGSQFSISMTVDRIDFPPTPNTPKDGVINRPDDLCLPENGRFGWHAGGDFVVWCRLRNTTLAVITLRAVLGPTDAALAQWASDVWTALYNAAQTQYYATQQALTAQLAALQAKVANIDTLTLRREENEEIMKGVLRWILGPTFQLMPADVADVFNQQLPPGGNLDLVHGTVANPLVGDALVVNTADFAPVTRYQELVKFVNEAIEWENVVYFLYSYFWDNPSSWDFVRQLRSDDPTRQAFLRAGSARVVLTVRQGWEKDWVNFVEGGILGTYTVPATHPYMSIAQEIEDYAQTNYPGIPSANPAGGPLPEDGNYASSVCGVALVASASPVDIEVVSSAGFLVGYTAIIDNWDTQTTNAQGATVTVQEAQTITAVPDATHITVAMLTYAHDGSKVPIPILQAGEQGQLMAEWYEYTPTSGTDLAVTSNLATIA